MSEDSPSEADQQTADAVVAAAIGRSLTNEEAGLTAASQREQVLRGGVNTGDRAFAQAR